MINVLFVCIGNSCRSQMAEGFARKYGSDVLVPGSAGIAPAPIVQPLTVEVMIEKNIDIRSQFPKSIYELDLNAFDVIVNMSGHPMPAGMRATMLVWDVFDPMTQPKEIYVEVRDKIEALVMKLILEVRRQTRAAAPVKPVPPNPLSVRPAVVEPEPRVTPNDSPQRFGFGRLRRSRSSETP